MPAVAIMARRPLLISRFWRARASSSLLSSSLAKSGVSGCTPRWPGVEREEGGESGVRVGVRGGRGRWDDGMRATRNGGGCEGGG